VNCVAVHRDKTSPYTSPAADLSIPTDFQRNSYVGTALSHRFRQPPPRISVSNRAPALLLESATWLEGRPWGCVGCFDLVRQFAEQAPIVDASLLREEFALFPHLPEGSAVGLWCLPDCKPEDARVVVPGSEGQYQIIAPSLAGLLAKIALQRFEEEDEWSDFTPHEDSDDLTEELGDRLREQLATDDLERIAEMPTELPDFGLWLAMTFNLSGDGRILPSFDYDARPMIGEVPADVVHARADLARAPRPARWGPGWLGEP
jgi:hypothetical protein